MATYNYYKEHKDQFVVPNMITGSNWIYVKIDFALQPMSANDVLQLFPIKNHWIIKYSAGRMIVATDGNATSDLGVTAGGQTIDAAFDQQSGIDGAGSTAWGPSSAAVDNAPLAITTDAYVFFENLTAACTSGSSEFLFEIIVPHTDMDSLTMSI